MIVGEKQASFVRLWELAIDSTGDHALALRLRKKQPANGATVLPICQACCRRGVYLTACRRLSTPRRATIWPDRSPFLALSQ